MRYDIRTRSSVSLNIATEGEGDENCSDEDGDVL